MDSKIFFTITVPNSGMGICCTALTERMQKKKEDVKLVQFVYKKDKLLFRNAVPEYGIIISRNNWFINDLFNMQTRALKKHVDENTKLIHFGDLFSMPDKKTLLELKSKGIKLVCTAYDMIDQVIGPYNYHVDEPVILKFFRKLLGKDVETRSRKNAEKLALMDSIITISEYTKRDVEMIFGLLGIDYPSKNVHAILLSNDKEIFKKSRASKGALRKKLELPLNKKIIVNVSSEEPRKNLRTVYKALSELPEEYLLVRVGSPSRSNKKLIAKLNIGNRVIFRSFPSNRDLADLYSAGDVFVFPTIYEGFGLPPLEAMACGLPVIGSDWTSMKEVIGKDAIILKDIFSETELAKRIIAITTDKKAWAKESERGIQQSKRFSWDQNFSETMKVYTSLLKK